jgi:glycerophosphoryl diester phosphodiesterase
MARPLLLGHRGAREPGSIRENSMAAFDHSLEHGCDGFEFDVRRTACGRAVVCHDPKAGTILISRSTRDQLLDLPCLEDVVRGYGQRSFLDIELKVRGLESTVLATLRDCPPERGFVVSSFLPDVVLELKARSATVPVGIICGSAGQLMDWRKLPAEYVMVHQSLVTRRLVQLIHDTGRKIFAWTVNTQRAMLKLGGWGVDGIISDDVRLLVRTLGSEQPSSLISERALRSAARISLQRRPSAHSLMGF